MTKKDRLRIGIIEIALLGTSAFAVSMPNSYSTQAALSSGTRFAKAAAAPVGSDGAAQAVRPVDVDWSIFLPAGDGQVETSTYCSSCHSIQQVVQARSDEAGWNATVRRMIDANDASIQPDDAATIIKYLATALSPSTPKLDLPIRINTAPKEMLNLMGKLSADDVQKILDARSKGKIQNFAALEALVGATKVAKYKSVLSFN